MPRYDRDSIQLNKKRDIPILQTALRAGFITSKQLFTIMNLHREEPCQRAFSNRIMRLCQSNLIEIVPAARIGEGRAFQIAELGKDVLLSIGEHYTTHSHTENAQTSFVHWLEINDLYIKLKKSKSLLDWIWGTQIKSQNDLSNSKYAKHYDAIISADGEFGRVRFAFEHERHLKTKARYAAINEAVQKERLVNLVLYTCLNANCRTLLSERFDAGQDVLVCIVIYEDFLNRLWDAPVHVAGINLLLPLKKILPTVAL